MIFHKNNNNCTVNTSHEMCVNKRDEQETGLFPWFPWELSTVQTIFGFPKMNVSIIILVNIYNIHKLILSDLMNGNLMPPIQGTSNKDENTHRIRLMIILPVF